MRIQKPCAALGGVIVLLATFGCASAHRYHNSSVAMGAAAPLAVAKANRVMAMDSANLPGAHPLGVVTFNMQRRQRPEELQLVAHHLRSECVHMPDFILCQEVMFSHTTSAEYSCSAAMLAEQLGYHVQGSQRRSGREGVAIVSKYPFAYFDARQLQTCSVIGFPRVSVMGEFLVPGVGRVRVVDVHLTHWGFEHAERQEQLEETLAWVRDRERLMHADVTLMGGDFNALPDSDEMTVINDAPPAFDLSLMNFNGDEPTKGGYGTWDDRIDYIFAAAPGHAMRFRGETRLWPDGISKANGRGRFWPSDHLLVMHQYEIGQATNIAAAAPANHVALVTVPGSE